MPFKDIKLHDGRHIPQLGYGSWRIPIPECEKQVDQAFELGFDHIDTAQVYYNEEGVGQAIKDSGLSRKEFWLTTKWSGVEDKEPRQSCEESLKKLGVDYVDLYLIHSPRLCKGDIKGTWAKMEDLYKEGKCKSIGVSNFTIEDLKELLKHCRVKPVVNQIKLEPYVIHSTTPLLEFMKEHDIVCEGYSTLIPLTSEPGGPVDKPVNEIAKRLGKKPEQILLAWSKAKNAVILTTSSRKERLQDYLDVGDIELTEDDVKAIDKAGAKGEKSKEKKAMVLKTAQKMAWAVLYVIALRSLFHLVSK